MVDKVKPLKVESSALGTEEDSFPTETNPQEDYLAAKGLSFEALDTHLAEKVGNVLKFTIPDHRVDATYNSQGEVTLLEYFKTSDDSLFMAKEMTYSSGFLSTEVIKIFASDETTILRTITHTYTYSGDSLSSVASVEV